MLLEWYNDLVTGDWRPNLLRPLVIVAPCVIHPNEPYRVRFCPAHVSLLHKLYVKFVGTRHTVRMYARTELFTRFLVLSRSFKLSRNHFAFPIALFPLSTTSAQKISISCYTYISVVTMRMLIILSIRYSSTLANCINHTRATFLKNTTLTQIRQLGKNDGTSLKHRTIAQHRFTSICKTALRTVYLFASFQFKTTARSTSGWYCSILNLHSDPLHQLSIIIINVETYITTMNIQACLVILSIFCLLVLKNHLAKGYPFPVGIGEPASKSSRTSETRGIVADLRAGVVFFLFFTTRPCRSWRLLVVEYSNIMRRRMVSVRI